MSSDSVEVVTIADLLDRIKVLKSMVVVLAHSALFWTLRNAAFFILRMTVELVAANLGSGAPSSLFVKK